MAAITYLIFMIIFILILSILDNVVSLFLYNMFLIYVATNISSVIDIPAGGLIVTEFILIMIILMGFYKLIYVAEKAKKRSGNMLEEI